MKPLKVLFVSHSFPRHGSDLENVGGMQRVSVHLWNELTKSPLFEAERMVLESDWDEIGRRTAGFLARLLFELPAKVHELKPDVVLFSSMVTASVLVPLRKKITVPVVAINHGQDVTMPNVLYQFWLKKVFSKLDATISVSAATREQTVNRGMKPKSAFIISNGFYPRKIEEGQKAVSKAKLIEKLRLPWNVTTPLLISVGRQVKRKGHVWFLKEVFPKITKEVNFLMIGDGPESSAVGSLARKYPNVFWAGRRSDAFLNLAYDASDLFIMPNIPISGDMEGFGIVLIEANAAGIPVVASRLEGIIDVIEDGQNGVLVEPLNPEAFASTIEAMLAEDLVQFSKRAQQTAEARFSWEKIIQNYHEVLSRVVQTHRKPS